MRVQLTSLLFISPGLSIVHCCYGQCRSDERCPDKLMCRCHVLAVSETKNNPVNMPDPIRKRFGYGQLRPLRPACSRNRAGSYTLDPTSHIHFSSVFPKKAWIILCKTEPDPIWMTWSGFGQTHQSVLETSRCAGIIWPGFWQDATGPLPFYHFLNLFRSSTDVLDNIVRIRFSSG